MTDNYKQHSSDGGKPRDLVHCLNLKNISSSIDPYFKQNLLGIYPALTPQELRICAMIRSDMHEEEISKLLHITPFTPSKTTGRVSERKNALHSYKKKNLYNALLNF